MASKNGHIAPVGHSGSVGARPSSVNTSKHGSVGVKPSHETAQKPSSSSVSGSTTKQADQSEPSKPQVRPQDSVHLSDEAHDELDSKGEGAEKSAEQGGFLTALRAMVEAPAGTKESEPTADQASSAEAATRVHPRVLMPGEPGGPAYLSADIPGPSQASGEDKPLPPDGTVKSDFVDISSTAGAASVAAHVFTPAAGTAEAVQSGLDAIESAARATAPQITTQDGVAAASWYDAEGTEFLLAQITTQDGVAAASAAVSNAEDAIAASFDASRLPGSPIPSHAEIESLKGTSPQAGDLTSIEGLSIRDVVARLPKNATREVFNPSRDGQITEGVKFSWTDAKGDTMRLWMHGPDASLQDKSLNASKGWVARLTQGKKYYQPLQGAFTNNQKSNESHIPIEGNPNAKSPAPVVSQDPNPSGIDPAAAPEAAAPEAATPGAATPEAAAALDATAQAVAPAEDLASAARTAATQLPAGTTSAAGDTLGMVAKAAEKLGGAVSLASGVLQLKTGVDELKNDDTVHGVTDVMSGGLNAVGGAAVLAGNVATGTIAVGGAAMLDGAVQIKDGLANGDKKETAVGTVKTLAGALMTGGGVASAMGVPLGPVAAAAGAGLYAAVAVYEHSKAIADAAKSVGGAVAEKATEAVGVATDAVQKAWDYARRTAIDGWKAAGSIFKGVSDIAHDTESRVADAPWNTPGPALRVLPDWVDLSGVVLF